MAQTVELKSKGRVIDSVWTLILAIAFVGPLALPLMWRNPRFSKNSKIFWSIVTIVVTVLAIVVTAKFSLDTFSAFKQAMGAEPCRFEQHLKVDPPGQKEVRVHTNAAGKGKAAYTDSKNFFSALKKLDGKDCDVNWEEAKAQIEWLRPWQSADTTVGSEISALIAKQKNPQAAARLSSTAAESANLSSNSESQQCAGKLSQLYQRISALKDKAYDSQKTRKAEIESILRSVSPGPLQ